MSLFSKLLSSSTLALAVLASQDTQTPLRAPRPEVRYVECGSAIWTGRIYDCGQIDVPLDWNNPAIGTITLNFTVLPVRRRIARRGLVFHYSGHEYLGRTFNPETALNMMVGSGRQLDTILLGYDVVTWTSRESAIADRARCFDIDDRRQWNQKYNSPFGAHESATVSFYNTTIRDVLHREPPWDDNMAWYQTQGPEDVKDMLILQEKLIAHCLDASPDRDLFKYVGTAASVRDMAALADVLDGPGSPINLWTKHHGSVLASHLLQMLPERVGKVVMDDPVDPISYQEPGAYQRWAAEIAKVNNTLSHIQLHDMHNGSTGFMQFSGHPVLDEVRMDQIIQFLHGELVEWHTRAEADYHLMTQEKEWDVWRSADPESTVFAFVSMRQSHPRGTNSARSTAHRGYLTRSLLDGMPLVCGDALNDHDTETSPPHDEVEAFVVDHMHSAPLIVSSAFPPLRHLCHLWPVRATERFPLRDAYRSSNENSQVLILLREPDYWNYFAVSKELARQRWPMASVVDGLHYGDLAWDHDQYSADIVNAFFRNDAALASQDTQQIEQIPLQSAVSDIRYVPCRDEAWSGRIYDCGQIDVPLDWNNAGLGSITLNFTALAVRRRIQRKGTVFYHSGHEYLGRTFHSENGINGMLGENKQLEKIISEYDLVTWTSRDSVIAERARCFAIDDDDYRRNNPRDSFGAPESELIAFYNATFLDDLGRQPPWDSAMAWTQTPTSDDVKDMLYAQEKLIAHCLGTTPDRDLFKYVGTAATARDLAALADALDGPGSPLNIWTKHHGSVVASHLLKLFPERIGRVVMDDPVDPVQYQAQEAYQRWAADIATVNNTAAHIQHHEMKNDSTGYMKFSGDQQLDEIRLDKIIHFLHSELVQWHTRSEADDHTIRQRKEWDLRIDNPNYRFMRSFFTRQSTGVNGWRSAQRSIRWASVLDGMPLVCGDVLYEHNADVPTMRDEVEMFLVNNMHAAPLIASSAFPPLRYLCHLWPIRAAERISLADPYKPLNEDSKVLVLLRDKDYWNYFSVSEALASWPTSSVVGGLHYGDLAWDNDQCTVDMIKAFYSNGTLPDGPRPCRYDDGAAYDGGAWYDDWAW